MIDSFENNDRGLDRKIKEALPPRLTKQQQRLLENSAKECTCLNSGGKIIESCKAHRRLVSISRIMQCERVIGN